MPVDDKAATALLAGELGDEVDDPWLCDDAAQYNFRRCRKLVFDQPDESAHIAGRVFARNADQFGAERDRIIEAVAQLGLETRTIGRGRPRR